MFINSIILNMKREIESKIIRWLHTSNKALLISGARQVGKTYIIRKVLKETGTNFLEINFILNENIKEALSQAENINEIINVFKRISPSPLKEKESVIFLDEVQTYPDIMTKIKFLVDEGSFKYVLSGSLLGVELNNISSVPVGYLQEIKMYPMTLFEFAQANGINDETIHYLKKCFKDKTKIDEVTHNKMMNVFYAYLVTGGMPDVVKEFINSGNLLNIHEAQKNIVNLYKADFTQYEQQDKKLRIVQIFDNIPSQLNKQNLKFVFTYLNKELKFDRYENSFLWLKEANVAYPIFNVSEIRPPLLISKEKNSFKLFMNDVGLLNSYYSLTYKQAIFEKNADNLLNLGGLFESFVASELKANNFEPYYYKGNKIGEIGFLVERDNKIIPIEVKSGSYSKNHNALNKLIQSEYKQYLSSIYVLHTKNLEVNNDITYLPIYLCGLIDQDDEFDYYIKLD